MAADRPALRKRQTAHPAEPEPRSEPEPAAPEAEVLLSVRIPARLRRRYRQAALDRERPMRELVVDALEQYLER